MSAAKEKPLAKSQQDLLDAMKAGIVIHYSPSMGRFQPYSYFFRNDNLKKVTAAAQGLIDKKLARKAGVYRNQVLELVAPLAANPSTGK
jgi:hypothetical protein